MSRLNTYAIHTLLLLALLLPAPSASTQVEEGTGAADVENHRTFEHTGWNDIVNTYVNEAGRFDYLGLLRHPTDIDRLSAYLERLEVANLYGLSDRELMAFWINAYNACAVRGVLDHYPIQSAMNVVGFFDARRCAIAGSVLSLNEIENERIGMSFNDPSVHFALCSVSRGSPPLRDEAYTGDALDEQLADQIHSYVVATTTIRPNLMEAELSKLFEWFGHDFDSMGGVRLFVSAHLDPESARLIRQESIMLVYSEWDWRLNDVD